MILAYKYGCLPPMTEGSRIADAMVLAHRYHNSLIEVERARVGAVRALLRKHATGQLADLYTEEDRLRLALDAAWTAVRAAKCGKRPEDRADKATVDALADEARRIGEMLAEVWAAQKPLKAPLYALLVCEPHAASRVALKAATTAVERKRVRDEARVIPYTTGCLKCVDNRAHDMTLRLYAAIGDAGLYWGTRLLVQDATEKAAESGTPQFRRWGERPDSIGVQLQNGLAVADLLACEDRRLRLSPEKIPGKTKLHLLRVRVGSDGRQPVFADFPIVIHRPLPKGGIVKWCRVKRTLIGRKHRWEAILSVEATAAAHEATKAAPGLPPGDTDRCRSTGASAFSSDDKGVRRDIAIDVGWRVMDDYIRVAYWATFDGREGELRDDGVDAELSKAASIRGFRDRLMDRLRDVLDVLYARVTEPPSWLREAHGRWWQWREPRRWMRLLDRWCRECPVRYLIRTRRAWTRRENHLHDYEDNMRDQALARRRDGYRKFARWAASHARVAVEAMDLRDFCVREVGEDPAEVSRRRRRAVAAPSELHSVLESACSLHGRALP